MRTLTPKEAEAFYDKFGEKQDKQSFYEARALQTLCANANLRNAQAVFELGCGTGRLALDLLANHLPGTAQYIGTDISATMVDIASRRLAPFAPRASVAMVGARPPLPLEAASIDRFIASYVLDLLSTDDQHSMLDEARRVLRADGLLCLAGITPGSTPLSRAIMGTWQWVFNRNPAWVGGCRPSRITARLPPDAWTISFHTVVVSWGVASEVLIASPASG